MSLSKKLHSRSDSQNSDSFSDCFQSIEDNYRRDSFSDRFCDDLCEEILKYLSLKDKLRLECVSKQFQRTVFQRQYELYINTMDAELHKNYLHSIKALLKKCPNITSIQLKGCSPGQPDYNPEMINEVFRLIIEICNNLSEINVENDINDSNFEEFHRKFGSKMKYLSNIKNLIDLNRFPNIEKIRIGINLPNYTIIRRHQSMIYQLKLAKLKQLKIALGGNEEYLIQALINNFPTLNHLDISFPFDHIATYKPLENISNLKHLIHFKYMSYSAKNNNRFFDLFKQMANNCQNLKTIECGFDINEQNSEMTQFLSLLKAFPAVKRLILRLYSVKTVDVNQLFSFELFKGFPNITHLTIGFDWNQTLKESILKGIDINLPKLQYLKIEYRFDTTQEEVTQMADILSRLSRLQTLQLIFKSGVDYKPIEEQITKKCRKIRKIRIETRDELNSRPPPLLIAIAN